MDPLSSWVEHRCAPPDRRCEGQLHELRSAYIWSSEEAASVGDPQQRVLNQAEGPPPASATARGPLLPEEEAGRRQGRPDPHRPARRAAHRDHRQQSGQADHQRQRAGQAKAAASALDGLYVLATNLPDYDRRRADRPCSNKLAPEVFSQSGQLWTEKDGFSCDLVENGAYPRSVRDIPEI